MSKNSLFWGQALKGRLQDKEIWAAMESLAVEPAKRLRQELDSGKLPFIKMPFKDDLEEELPRVMQVFGRKFKHMLLLGIGGSALGPRALQKAFMPQQDWPGHEGPWLWIADNIDALGLPAWMDKLPPEDTLVVVISKSGGTIETMAQYFIVREWMQKKLGQDWTKHLLVITDSDKGALRKEVEELGLASLPVPDNLGGRYSVLCAVGMVPAMFCGLDWKGLLDGAQKVFAPLVDNPDSLSTHPAWRLACWNKALMEHGYNQLIFFSYIPAWSCFGAWFNQLWAESLGKEGKGSMPLPAVGVTDQHSLLQMFLDGPQNKACLFLESPSLPGGPVFNNVPEQWSYLKDKHFGDLLAAEAIGTRGAFSEKNIPLVRISVGSTTEESAGSVMALLGLTTIFTGWLLGINPLDQPAVESGKRLANARLGARGYTVEEEALKQYFAVPDEQQDF